MNVPIVSVIMSAYNAEKYLNKSIDSILNQTFKDFEFIIINDGSYDSTENIILSYDDPRIVYVKNDVNLKLIKSLNKGIFLAKGKYISRMDADDIALPTLLENEVDCFNRVSNVDIVNVLTFHLSEDGKKKRPNLARPVLNSSITSIVNIFQNILSHPGIMVKASLMRKYLYLDESWVVHFEDAELWSRMFLDGITSYIINKRLLLYRESSSSINAVYGEERMHRYIEYQQRYLLFRYNYTFTKDFWESYAKPRCIKDIMNISIELRKFEKFLLIHKIMNMNDKYDFNYWRSNYVVFLVKTLFCETVSLKNKLRLIGGVLLMSDTYTYMYNVLTRK